MTATSDYHWFKVNLGDAMLAEHALAELNIRLLAAYDAAGKPANMQACYRHESAGIHCNLLVYVSAELQRIVLLDNAVPCKMPLFCDVCFLIGGQMNNN